MRQVATPLRTLLAGLSVLCMAASVQAQTPGFPFDPTHYWTYQMEDSLPIVPPTTILARDQFFRGGVALTVDRRERLLNWVFKNNSPVPDSLLHYTWWNVLDKLPVNKTVIVTNQFGSSRVQVLNLEFLLAPALKNVTTPPLPQANHYLCYRATGFPAPTQGYDMRDEWRVDFQQPQALEFLCAPCAKQHAGVTFPVVDTVTHFAVYPITPTSGNFVPFVRDQFVNRQEFVHQVPIEYLFVPSEKTEPPTDVKRDTWGRLKRLYR